MLKKRKRILQENNIFLTVKSVKNRSEKAIFNRFLKDLAVSSIWSEIFYGQKTSEISDHFSMFEIALGVMRADSLGLAS